MADIRPKESMVNMYRDRTVRVIATALTLFVIDATAAQIQPGRIYVGGEEINDPESGLKLTLPAGWRGRLSPDEQSFIMESEAGGGYMMVLADMLTEAEARQQMTEPVDLGDGVVLTPNGDVQSVASGHLAANYSVSGSAAQYVGTVDVNGDRWLRGNNERCR